MRILVCGGRDYRDQLRLFRELDKLDTERDATRSIACVIHGGATGADMLADRWASERRIPREAYFAEWKRFGKAAGVLRNQRMLDEGRPDVVVAFPGGRGTADMVSRARRAGLRVFEVG